MRSTLRSQPKNKVFRSSELKADGRTLYTWTQCVFPAFTVQTLRSSLNKDRVNWLYLEWSCGHAWQTPVASAGEVGAQTQFSNLVSFTQQHRTIKLHYHHSTCIIPQQFWTIKLHYHHSTCIIPQYWTIKLYYHHSTARDRLNWSSSHLQVGLVHNPEVSEKSSYFHCWLSQHRDSDLAWTARPDQTHYCRHGTACHTHRHTGCTKLYKQTYRVYNNNNNNNNNNCFFNNFNCLFLTLGIYTTEGAKKKITIMCNV